MLSRTVPGILKAQCENPAVMTISVPDSHPKSRKGYQEEVRKKNKMLVNNLVTGNFWYSKISIQFMSC